MVGGGVVGLEGEVGWAKLSTPKGGETGVSTITDQSLVFLGVQSNK